MSIECLDVITGHGKRVLVLIGGAGTEQPFSDVWMCRVSDAEAELAEKQSAEYENDDRKVYVLERRCRESLYHCQHLMHGLCITWR